MYRITPYTKHHCLAACSYLGARGATCMKLHQVARYIVALAIQGMGALPLRAEQPKFLISMECASRFVRSPLSGIFLGLEEQL